MTKLHILLFALGFALAPSSRLIADVAAPVPSEECTADLEGSPCNFYNGPEGSAGQAGVCKVDAKGVASCIGQSEATPAAGGCTALSLFPLPLFSTMTILLALYLARIYRKKDSSSFH